MLAAPSSLWLLYHVYAAFVILEPDTRIHATLQRVSLDRKITAKYFNTSTAKMRWFVAFVYILAITHVKFLYNMLRFS